MIEQAIFRLKCAGRSATRIFGMGEFVRIFNQACVALHNFRIGNNLSYDAEIVARSVETELGGGAVLHVNVGDVVESTVGETLQRFITSYLVHQEE